MSGAPLWQIRRKMAQYELQREMLVKELVAQAEEKRRPADPPNVLVDAVSLPTDGKAKPLVRHVIVKDLNRVAQMKNIDFPTWDIFQNKAPVGLYALFDGQACGAAPGPVAAEFCARNFHGKVLENLAMLRQGVANETYVKAALIKSFHDLDAECLAQHPEGVDGCGAAVALLVGGHLFVAVLGRCSALFAETDESGRTREMPFAMRAAAQQGSLGEPARKKAGMGVPTSTPEVHEVELDSPSRHPFLLLVSSSVAAVLDPVQLLETAEDFHMQPRVVCGEITARAAEVHAQGSDSKHFLSVQVCFLPARDKSKELEKGKLVVEASASTSASASAAKRAKLGSKTVRLRHILMRHQEAPQAGGKPGTKKSTRTRHEAEVVLRRLLRDLKQDTKVSGKVPKTAADLVVLQGRRFSELCREFSECPTARKGGAVCGDLGWMSLEDLSSMGGNFREKVDPLSPGHWSDVVSSEQGAHLVQRVA